MKVALYFFRLAQSSGGAERMLFALAEALTARGHEIHVVSWDPPDSTAFYAVPAGVTWHRLGFAPGARDKLRRIAALARVLRRSRCQVLVGFVMSTDKTVYAACRLAGVPVVAAERNSPEMYRLKYDALTTGFYMRLLRSARAVVVQLEGYRQGYPAWLQERIVAIPNPVPRATCTARPDLAPDGRWILLSAGRLEPQKNHEQLLRAFAQLTTEHPEWVLRIVGDGGQRDRLQRLCEELSIGARVELPGAVAGIEAEYCAAHLFCLASRWEGFPNALVEAMAHGLPAVGFAGCPGINALVTDGVDGLLAEGNGNEVSLADALRRLMADAAARVAFGRNAALIGERFDAAAIVPQWEQVIADAAGATRRA